MTETKIISAAMRELAVTIQSDDGVIGYLLLTKKPTINKCSSHIACVKFWVEFSKLYSLTPQPPKHIRAQA